MKKILRLNARTFPLSETERRILTGAGELVEAELVSDAAAPGEFSAVQIISAYLREADIAALTSCRIISRLGNGCDKIDLDAAAQHGIVVANVPDSFTAEVADHTVALMLAGLRKLGEMEKLMRSGRRPEGVGGIHRIAGLRLGIVGFGRIGRLVAERTAAFGMKISFCDPGVSAESCNRFEKKDFDTLLCESDILCLTCPLTPATRGMLGWKEFRKMKPGAMLINTARGELVRESELAEALEAGVVGFAGLDVFGEVNVFGENGFSTAHPLFSAPNCLMTPHVSANSFEAREETFRRAAEATAGMLNGVLPENIVNRKLLEQYGKLPAERGIQHV